MTRSPGDSRVISSTEKGLRRTYWARSSRSALASGGTGLAAWRLNPLCFQESTSLFRRDWRRPGIAETKSCGLFFCTEFGRCFNDPAQRVAYFPGVFAVGEVDAPKLVPRWMKIRSFSCPQ